MCVCVCVCMCVCVCVCVCVRAYRAGHTKDIRNPYPPTLHFFVHKKNNKLGNKEKIKEFESKNYIKADQSQNVTGLVITCSRHLEFKNFPHQATMVAANTFCCS